MNGEEATNNSTKSSFVLLVVASQTFSKEQKEQVLRRVRSSRSDCPIGFSCSLQIWQIIIDLSVLGLCQIEVAPMLVNLTEELDYVI